MKEEEETTKVLDILLGMVDVLKARLAKRPIAAAYGPEVDAVLDALHKRAKHSDDEDEDDDEEDIEEEEDEGVDQKSKKKTKKEAELVTEEPIDMAPWEDRYTKRRALTEEEIEKIKADVAVELEKRETELTTFTKTKRNDHILSGVQEKFQCHGNVDINPTVNANYKPAQTEFVLCLAAYALIDSEVNACCTGTYGRIGIIRMAMKNYAEDLAARSPLSSGIDTPDGYTPMITDLVSGVLFIKNNTKKQQ